MHKLTRQVRFSINPFLPQDIDGENAFASKPAGEGLAIFLEIGIALVGGVDKDSGFVINVLDIDEQVRQYVVPIFAETVRTYYRRASHIGYAEIAELLRQAKDQLAGKFGKAVMSEISLKLNPYRKLAIDCEDKKMIYFSEKFEFAAMHKLWNEEFASQWNFDVFGKCANPSGHGHNYIIEVTVKFPGGDLLVGEFEKVVDDNLIKLIDHKNLNADVPYFAKTNPTVENIAIYAWEQLSHKFHKTPLHSITVWETDKTCCSYYG